jgi:quercetin dioxygenase-like cupin family protein
MAGEAPWRRRTAVILRPMSKILLAASGFMLLGTSLLLAQAVGGPEKGVAVKGDPGISSMRVLDRPDYFVLRDWAEPGAVRRMHNHPNTTYHVFTLVTGQLRLTIEGQAPIDVKQGEVVELNNAAMHTFTNTGTVTATIVEVFGRAPKQ